MGLSSLTALVEQVSLVFRNRFDWRLLVDRTPKITHQLAAFLKRQRQSLFHQTRRHAHTLTRANSSGNRTSTCGGIIGLRPSYSLNLLYRASQAGVQCDLLVRGICSLRPGVPGVSENIRVISIVGRFLEHSRIYYFQNGGDEEMYLGSADLMPRNLTFRVETVFPVRSHAILRHLRDDVLETYLADNMRSRVMQPHGGYARTIPLGDARTIDSQVEQIERAVRADDSKTIPIG